VLKFVPEAFQKRVYNEEHVLQVLGYHTNIIRLENSFHFPEDRLMFPYYRSGTLPSSESDVGYYLYQLLQVCAIL
jgi:serine/threonine protein kinase